MIEFKEIRDVHLEISSKCNAACPMCPRNFRGYPYNDGYPETNLTLSQVKHIFNPDFVAQLNKIRINGNYGDIVMNPEGADIVEYLRSCNQNMILTVSTNGSARKAEFWQRLAAAGARVLFCLDGLDDTHHLYRQNTSWKTIIRNANVFIQAGGDATWKFIEFDHNIHQVDACEQLAAQLGFASFQRVNHNRNIGPAFDKKGNLSHVIGKYQGTTEFKVLFHHKKTDLVLLEDITPGRTPKTKITCETMEQKSIYIAANGDVYPCCWTGFYPKTYGHGEYHQAVNAQLAPLINGNNALENSLEDCIIWFKKVKTAWNHSKYEQGRLIACDDNCGA